MEVASSPDVRRSMRRVTSAWMFGSIWATATAGAPLTQFARGLGTSNFQFGLLAALPFVASLIYLPAAVYSERLRTRKTIFLISLYAQRLLWIPIGLIPLWMSRSGHTAGLWSADVFLLLMLLMYLVGNIGGPAWISWMADMVPERVRGNYFSVRRQMGIIAGIPAAVIVGLLMDRCSADSSQIVTAQLMTLCAAVFVLSAPFGVADIFHFHFIPDPARPPRKTPWLQSLRRPLHDRQFLWFAGFVATMTFAISFMGQFVTLYLEEEVHATNTGTQLITLVAPMLAQLFMLGVWGKAVDRMGKKPVLIIAAAGLAPVGLGWCFMTISRIWLGYILSALGGMLWAGIEVANFNLVLEMSATQEQGREGDSSFFAVNSVIINIAGCFGGVAAGIIGQVCAAMTWQPVRGFKALTFFDLLFFISAVLRLAAVFIFLPKIRETTARPTREALRFMTANIYNNVFQAILQPLRNISSPARAEESGEEG